jgi:hypothetical protein
MDGFLLCYRARVPRFSCRSTRWQIGHVERQDFQPMHAGCRAGASQTQIGTVGRLFGAPRYFHHKATERTKANRYRPAALCVLSGFVVNEVFVTAARRPMDGICDWVILVPHPRTNGKSAYAVSPAMA